MSSATYPVQVDGIGWSAADTFITSVPISTSVLTVGTDITKWKAQLRVNRRDVAPVASGTITLDNTNNIVTVTILPATFAALVPNGVNKWTGWWSLKSVTSDLTLFEQPLIITQGYTR